MNLITAKLYRSKFVRSEHLGIFIDGQSLDLVVAPFFQAEARIEGLVPTLLDWLADEKEREIVWEQAMPPEGVKMCFPVLMCPDDVDLWCTVVVAEVESNWTQVIWHRMGLDVTPSRGFTPARLGTNVKWAANLGPFVFKRSDYMRCLKVFEDALGS